MARLRARVACAAVLIAAAFAVAAPCSAQTQTQPPPKTPPKMQPPSAAGASQDPSKPPQRTYVPVQPKVSIESSQELFATMCALWAAGYNSDVSTSNIPAMWAGVAAEMLKKKGPATEALRKYFDEHEHRDRAATLSHFVSFALVAGPPPEFQYTLRHDELPPDLLAMEDFNAILAKFYAEAEVEAAWHRVEAAYPPVIRQLQGPLTQIVLKTTGYLREVLQSTSQRKFVIYVEPLVGVHMNLRNYGDSYSVVLDGSTTVSVDQIRHSFLHFLLDPLPVKYRAAITLSRPLLDAAARAPRLPREYRTDLTGFYTECLIKAVELELDRMTAEQRARAVDAEEAEGYVLVRPLVRELEKFQLAEPAMTYYFPDLAKGINVAAEMQRLQAVQFAPALEAPPADPAATDAAEREQMLQQGERLLASQDGGGAQQVFEKVLARWPGTPRATYGMAIAAVFQGQGERAKELFTSLTRPAAGAAASGAGGDPIILAWSHVYLGRMSDLKGDREEALGEYRAALNVQGAPEAARLAAQRGVEKAYQKPGPSADH